MAAGVSLLAFAAGAAQAQTETAAPVQLAMVDDAGGALQDIVVTAERREVNLQQAPLAVSAITADALKAANITDITGLNGTVPGLVVARSGGGERMLSIRGIGSETPENTNTQPGVSYHIDGVYIFNSIAASAAFIDVAQVEVLRGPQGTMFGQGSTGGTINVVSIEPDTSKLTGRAGFGAGNHGWIETDAAVNVPLGETLAVRGAFQYMKHDGYAHATGVPGYDEYELDDADELGWRIGAKWAPSSSFSLTLNTIQYKSDTHGAAQKNILDPEPDPRVLSQDFAASSMVDTELYTAVARWETPFAVIKSISSYQKLHSEQAWDSDGLTAELFNALTYNPLLFGGLNYDHTPLWRAKTESWTQEINLSSNSDGPFQWIAGGVYLHSKNSQYIVEYRTGADMDLLRPALPADTPWNSPLLAKLTYAELSSIKRKAWAVFAQGTYDVTSALSITAGLRYNKDKYRGMFSSFSGGMTDATSGAYLQPTDNGGKSGDEITGKLAVEYEFTPRNMVYVSYTRGYKPGAINQSVVAGGTGYSLGWDYAVQPTYQDEKVASFEVGTKNRFLDNTLQLNAAAFFYKYKNMQFLEEDAVLYGEGISNAPKAEVYGVEVETSWLPTETLRFDGSMSWLEGKFTEDYYALDPADAAAAQVAAGYPDWLFWSNFYAAAMARDAARQNINGNRIPKLPRWQGSFSATYTNQVGPGVLTARAQYIYRGKYQYRLFNNAATDITPSYSQVNLMLKYEPDNSGLDLTFRVTNLFNKDGINSRFSDPYGSAQVSDTFIPPRQMIVSVGYKF